METKIETYDLENFTDLKVGVDFSCVEVSVRNGKLVFKAEDDKPEYLRFESDGKVYVRGELVDNNKDVYLAFRAWLRRALLIPSLQDETAALIRVTTEE